MQPSDKTGKALRFGCGFVFGLAFFGISSIWFVIEEPGNYVAAILVGASVFGLAALRFGEAFWRVIGRWFSWFV